jgi:hypothetical protein
MRGTPAWRVPGITLRTVIDGQLRRSNWPPEGPAVAKPEGRGMSLKIGHA